MFTNRRFDPTTVFSGDWNQDGPRLLRLLNEYFDSLETPNSLDINEAQIEATNGVQFPATQNASSDVNTLDDYEEGTLTPGISFGGGTTGITYTTRTGSYTKIGNRVFVNGYILLSSKGSATGSARITGLSFTSRNNDDALSPASLRLVNVSFGGQFMGFVEKNTTTILLQDETEAGVAADLDDTNFANDSQVMFAAAFIV